jgi:dolichyl-diphosphooligosaccharide--protein glycosyltransferase
MSSPDDAWVILNSSAETNVPEYYVSLPEEFQNGIDYATLEAVNAKGEKYSPEISGLYSDYIVIYLAADRYEVVNAVTGEPIFVYDLSAGGDESKKYWFARIAGLHPLNYVATDGITPTNEFNDNTLFGKLIPFSLITFVDIETMEYHDTYEYGLTALYIKNIKFTDPDGPFTLVYASPSFSEQGDGGMITVLIYKVNHNYMQ